MLMWYNDLEIHNVSDRTKLGVHHFIYFVSSNVLKWCSLVGLGIFCVCFLLFWFGFFPGRVDEKRWEIIVLIFWEGEYRDLLQFLPCHLPQTNSASVGLRGRKGKNLEGLAPCSFLLAKAGPAKGGDLTVERILCSSEEVWISASKKISLKAWGLWRRENTLKKTKQHFGCIKVWEKFF